MPLVRQRSLVFGSRLTSLPWVDEAGAVGTPEAVAALLARSVELAHSAGTGCEAVSKQPLDSDLLAPVGWVGEGAEKVLVRLRLPGDSQTLWSNLSAKVRNQARKAEKCGVEVESGGAELVGDFYAVYSENMRDLGSPSHSRQFFEVLAHSLADAVRLYVARAESQVVGAGLVLRNGDSLDIPWASSRRSSNHLCVNHGVYWRILADAADGGFGWFRFGRSTIGSGQHRFKMQWGAEEAPLRWLRYAPHATEGAPDAADGSPGRTLELAQRVWRRLPLGLARRLGPVVVRNAP